MRWLMNTRTMIAGLGLLAALAGGAWFGSATEQAPVTGAPMQQEAVMVTGQILSPWKLIYETEPGQEPVLAGREPVATGVWHAAGQQWQNMRDITAQELGADDELPDPNLALWEVSVTTDVAFDALDADGRCFVLWETVIVAPSAFGLDAAGELGEVLAARQSRGPGGAPSPAEFGQLRAFLARSGLRQVDVDAVAGRAVNGRARAEIGEDIRTWLVDREWKRAPTPTPGG